MYWVIDNCFCKSLHNSVYVRGCTDHSKRSWKWWIKLKWNWKQNGIFFPILNFAFTITCFNFNINNSTKILTLINDIEIFYSSILKIKVQDLTMYTWQLTAWQHSSYIQNKIFSYCTYTSIDLPHIGKFAASIACAREDNLFLSHRSRSIVEQHTGFAREPN